MAPAPGLLAAYEDPGAVGQVIVDALARGTQSEGPITTAIAPYAGRYGLPKGDGVKLMDRLVEIATRR